jgi:hypothetical protein
MKQKRSWDVSDDLLSILQIQCRVGGGGLEYFFSIPPCFLRSIQNEMNIKTTTNYFHFEIAAYYLKICKMR